MSAALPTDEVDAIPRRMLAEQTALLYRPPFPPLAGSVLSGAIVASLAIEDSGLFASALWYGAAMTMMAVRLYAGSRFAGRTYTYDELKRRRSTMLVLI